MGFRLVKKIYDKEWIKGLKTRQSGRPFELSEDVVYQIKKELKESSYGGWTTKQAEEELIVKKSGIKYHYTRIYRIFANEFKQKIPRKVHVNTASLEEKEDFKKRSQKYLWTDNNKKKNKTPDLR